MAERFFAKRVKIDYVSDFMTDLIDNNGVVKTTITTTPVNGDIVVFTYFNDIPVIALKSGAVVEYEYGSDVPTWSSLFDVTDGDHSTGFVFYASTNDLDMNTLGTYTVNVYCEDASGNKSNTVDVDITIVDTTIPVIADAETLVTTYESGAEVPSTWLTGITATDGYDGDITSSIVVDDSAVDMVTAGTFDITYDVDDSSSNSATTLTKTITITA